MKKPRKLSLVRMTDDYADDTTVPFHGDQPLVFLGEIPNMPGSCVLVGHKSGKVYSGFHTERFQELKDDEV